MAVAATGAYCITMSNNYNGALRPPVILCRDGEARLAVRRETIEDLLRRDVLRDDSPLATARVSS